ncbi:HD-GYP domain-containing protein [Candidatus Latescibacterota bacterium]
MDSKEEIKYSPVKLKTIRADTLGSFSIYIKVSDNYVLYHANGEKVSQDILNKLINNNVQVVYIQKNEKDQYNEYLERNLTNVLADPAIPVKEKAEIAHHSLTNIAESLFERVPQLQTLNIYNSSVSKVTDFILGEEQAIYNLIKMSSLDFKISTHSINVGMFSLGLAKILLAKDSRYDIQDAATGFFLHDIGKSIISPKTYNKITPLTYDEWRMLKQHPTQGYKIINKYNLNNDLVKTIIMQHHERSNGKGYPFGLKGDQIHICSKICALADSFEALTAYRPYRPPNERKFGSFKALQKLKEEMSSEFSPDFFQKFVMMFSKSMNS